MFPMVLSLIAFYVILDFVGQYAKWLGLNTHAGLILVYLGGISGYIWMIKGYFEMIPASMEESARIDGANQFQTFIWILLPMSLPIFSVVFILSFISYMSEYPVASVVLQSNDNWTLAVGANSFLFEQKEILGPIFRTSGFERRSDHSCFPAVPEIRDRRVDSRRRQRIARWRRPKLRFKDTWLGVQRGDGRGPIGFGVRNLTRAVFVVSNRGKADLGWPPEGFQLFLCRSL